MAIYRRPKLEIFKNVTNLKAQLVHRVTLPDGRISIVPEYNTDGTPKMGNIKTLKYNGEVIWQKP